MGLLRAAGFDTGMWACSVRATIANTSRRLYAASLVIHGGSRLPLRLACATLAALILAPSAHAQQSFPARGVEIVNELYAGTDPKNDDARRIAIHRTCAQMVFELGAQWGNKKRAGLPDEFRSPDSIAYLEPDGSVSIWDIQASSGAILVHAGKPPDYPKDSPANSTFMACSPANYLNPAPPMPTPGTPVPIPGTPTLDLSHLATKDDIAALRQELAAVKDDTQEIRAGMNRVLKFTSKYILPVLGAVAAGWYMKPAEEQQ